GDRGGWPDNGVWSGTPERRGQVYSAAGIQWAGLAGLEKSGRGGARATGGRSKSEWPARGVCGGCPERRGQTYLANRRWWGLVGLGGPWRSPRTEAGGGSKPGWPPGTLRPGGRLKNAGPLLARTSKRTQRLVILGRI